MCPIKDDHLILVTFKKIHANAQIRGKIKAIDQIEWLQLIKCSNKKENSMQMVKLKENSMQMVKLKAINYAFDQIINWSN